MIKLLRRTRTGLPAQLLLLLALVPGAMAARPEPFPGMDEKWRYYRTPNFEMYSGNGDADSREILRHLELLRAVFLNNFKLVARVAQPVTIFYFHSDRDFRGYWPLDQKPDDDVLGFCGNQRDRTIITMAQTDEVLGHRVIYHEYIHYLFRVAEETPPLWYNEGTAELFSTLDDQSDELILGLPIANAVTVLQHNYLIPLEDLFAVTQDSAIFRDSDRKGLFTPSRGFFFITAGSVSPNFHRSGSISFSA